MLEVEGGDGGSRAARLQDHRLSSTPHQRDLHPVPHCRPPATSGDPGWLSDCRIQNPTPSDITSTGCVPLNAMKQGDSSTSFA